MTLTLNPLSLLLLSFFCVILAESPPANAQVTGLNSVSGTPLYIGAGGAIYMNVDTTGNIGVGIGTASPAALFDAGGSGLFHVGGNVGCHQRREFQLKSPV